VDGGGTLTINNVDSVTGAGELDAATLIVTGLTANSAFKVNVTDMKLTSSGGNIGVTSVGDINLNGGTDITGGSFSLTTTTLGSITGTLLSSSGVTDTLFASGGSINLTTGISGTLAATTTGAGNGIVIANTSNTSDISLGAIKSAGSVNISSKGGITVGSSTFNAGGAITLSNITSGDVSVTGATFNSSGTISLADSAGNIAFSGGVSIGGGNLSISATNGSLFTLNGALTMASGKSVTASNLSANNATITTSGSGSVTINGATTGNSLTINAGGTSGNVSLLGVGLTSLTVMTGSSGSLNLGGNVDAATFDASALAGKVVIDSNISITSHGLDLGASSGIVGATNGGQALTINAGSNAVTLPGVGVGGNKLGSLTINGGTIKTDAVNTTGGQAYKGTLELDNALLNTGNGAITVTGDLNLTGVASITNDGGGVTVTGKVDGSHKLSVAATGKVGITGAVGGTAPLTSLSLKGSTITLDSAVNTVLDQSYTGAVILKAGLTSTGGSISFAGGKLDVQDNLVITADSIGFDGGNDSVTSSTASLLAIVPATAKTAILVGGASGSGVLGLNANALNGYEGSLFIGGVPASFTDPNQGVVKPVAAGDITVNGDIALGGSGTYLVITSTGSLNLNSTLQADNIIVGGTTGVFNPNNAGDLVVGNTLIVVGDIVGEEGKDIQAEASSGGATLIFATHSTQAVVKLTGINKLPFATGDTASTYAIDLGVDVNTGATLQNSGEQAAANQQTGGLLGSGFIDVSVFQQISLYDVNGSGIQLPGDQCEEESTTGTGCGQ
jgi:hypothetical protein